MHSLNELKDKAVETRQKARVQLATRTAVLIIQQKRPQDIEAFRKQCRLLGVTVSGQIQKRLAAMGGGGTDEIGSAASAGD